MLSTGYFFTGVVNLSEGGSSRLSEAFFIALLMLGEALPDEMASWRIVRACLLYSRLDSCYCYLSDFSGDCFSGDWDSDLEDGSFFVLLLVWRILRFFSFNLIKFFAFKFKYSERLVKIK